MVLRVPLLDPGLSQVSASLSSVSGSLGTLTNGAASVLLWELTNANLNSVGQTPFVQVGTFNKYFVESVFAIVTAGSSVGATISVLKYAGGSSLFTIFPANGTAPDKVLTPQINFDGARRDDGFSLKSSSPPVLNVSVVAPDTSCRVSIALYGHVINY